MGQRANLIVLEGNQYELYYDHWCANSLDAYLFWGASQALEFFRDHDKQGDQWWLDTVWCEGGAVIDLDRKVLLWFGGEDISYDIPLRRFLLELMKRNWHDFQVLWAYEGIADLADYVGYDRNKVIVSTDEKEVFDAEKVLKALSPKESQGYLDCAVSIQRLNGEIEIRTGSLWHSLQSLLLYGNGMVEIIQETNFQTTYMDDPEGDNALLVGAHVDLQKEELHIWSCSEEILDLKQIGGVWDGYQIFNHKDRFEVHEELTGGKLRFAQRDRTRLLDKVKQIVCRDSQSPLNTLDSMVAALTEHGEDVKVSPAAYVASQFKSDKAFYEALFDQMFAR